MKPLIVSVALGLTLAFLCLSPLQVMATNDQTPNWQILSSNTQTETGSPFDRFSVNTNNVFYGDSSNNAFTYQMNAVVNDCTGFPTPCSGSYWMQGVVGIDNGSAIGKSGGNWVHDAHIELVWGPANGNCGYEGDCTPTCQPTIPSLVNIDQTTYNVLEQITIDPSSATSPLTLEVAVADTGTNQVFYDVKQSCGTPSGATTVDYFTRLEGVIVGCCGNSVTFTPSSTLLFYDYIDMLSSYNHMSNSSQSTQTAEGSNLYQDPSSCYAFTDNGYYAYTIQADEYTNSVSASC